MSATPNISHTAVFADRRAADLFLAWLDAADDATEAYLAWRDAERGNEPLAFVVYRAALDREEAAAAALQHSAERLTHRLYV